MKTNVKKQATLLHALIPIVFLIVSLMYTIFVVEGSPHIPLALSALVAGAVAMIGLGFSWAELEEGIVETIKMSMGAIIILMIIGMIIGTWILGGVVPTMIYYGLQILSPSIFLVTACILCAVVALATGSSWTTAGTVGIALIGIGNSLGIPMEVVAGAIISGAYFGDKMSPLSDTTNLAPAMAGTTLFEHVRHMVYTTGPSLLIALVIYAVLGIQYAGNTLDVASIQEVLTGLSSQFTINPIMLLAPILVIAMVVLKVPAIPGLFGGTLLGALMAILFQGADVGAIITAMNNGFVSTSGIEVIDTLLTRGGLQGMMGTVSLILCAMCFGGIMEKAGFLEAIAKSILRFANSTGSLVLATIITIIAINVLAGDQYLSIVIPGRMYKSVYDERGLHPKNLSRILEDAGTITSPLVPWNTCGSFMSTTLGVATFAYLPYCFLNLINPLVSIFYGYTGITMEKAVVDTKAA